MSDAHQKIETVRDLLNILSVCSPDLKIRIMQPRRWVKKQPDNTNTYVRGVEINGYWFILQTSEDRP